MGRHYRRGRLRTRGAPVVGRGKLGRTSGTKKLSLKLARKLKKGTYALTVVATAGQTSTTKASQGPQVARPDRPRDARPAAGRQRTRSLRTLRGAVLSSTFPARSTPR